MKSVILVFGFLLLASCAVVTSEKYEAQLNTWLGQPEEALVSSWGVPDGSYERKIDGINVKYLTYNSTRNVYIPDANNMGTAFSGSFVARSCKTSFAIDKDANVIASWKYDGNDCVAQ